MQSVMSLFLLFLFISSIKGKSVFLNDATPAPVVPEGHLNLNESYFPSLENYEVNATAVSEEKYIWIARVIHSRTADYPHVCTATCIDEAIFITASRCLFSLKVNLTSILYMSKRLNAVAFVVPSKPTKQAFDDIGFIVVDNTNYKGMWAVIELFDATNRTDDSFVWFANLDIRYGAISYKVVGYTMKKGIHRIKAPDRQYNLTELTVLASLDICSDVLTQYKRIRGFRVPCYYTCTFQQFIASKDNCYKYHGVEGGAVIDTKKNKLIGIATWGAYFVKYELPVGFSIVNSENFFKDYACARRIRDDNGLLVTAGYYQTLCDGL